MPYRTLLLAAFGLLVAASPASTIVSMVGDEDAFGLRPNGTSVANGTDFVFGLGGQFEVNYGTASDPGFTDFVSSIQSPTYKHVYTLDGVPVTATLSMRFASIADGNFGPYNVTYSGIVVGQITRDTSSIASRNVRNFNFNVPVALLLGSNMVNIGVNPTTSGNADTFGMDFSRLTITTQAVPEPATLAALSIGAVGLLRRRRR